MLKDFYTELEILEVTKTSDGIGGTIKDYKKSIAFLGAIAVLSANERLANDKLGVDSTHSLICDKTIKVKYEDVINDSCGNSYKVVNNPREEVTPNISNLDIQKVVLRKVI